MPSAPLRFRFPVLATGLALAMGASWPAWAAPPFGDYARLGLRVQPMSPELRIYFGAPPDRGVLVSQVEEGSPAAAAGLRSGDVVVEAGGEPVASPRDLVWQALRAPEAEPFPLVVLRRGERLELPVVPRGAPHPPLWDREELWGPGQTEMLRELREQLRKLERRLEELEDKVGDAPVDRTGVGPDVPRRPQPDAGAPRRGSPAAS